MRNHNSIWLLSAMLLFYFFTSSPAQTHQEAAALALSDSIGIEIDSSEQHRYHLFPDIGNFLSARIYPVTEAKYRLVYNFTNRQGVLATNTKFLSAEAVALTRLHVANVDAYLKMQQFHPISADLSAEVAYRLALKFAHDAEYDLTLSLAQELIQNFPASPLTAQALVLKSQAEQILKTRKTLIWKGALRDQSGRTEMLIFSGYYGVWLGIATPIALEANSPQAIALGLLLGGPGAILITYNLTKDADISDSRAEIITLGGHLGTWQGLGWAAYNDKNQGKDVVAAGEIVGLAGLVSATLLTQKVDFSSGHAALTSSGLPWGAWLGMVVGGIAEHEDTEMLRDMLIGSNVLVAAAGFGARDVEMSKARVRFMNLAGVVGAMVGFGVDLFFEIDDGRKAMAIAGLGSTAGAALGLHFTRNYDKKSFSHGSHSAPSLAMQSCPDRNELVPMLTMRPNPLNKNELIPYVGIQCKF